MSQFWHHAANEILGNHRGSVTRGGLVLRHRRTFDQTRTALLRRWMPLFCFQDSRFCKTNLVLNRMVLCARPATFGADKSFRRKEIERTALRAPLMLSDRDCRRFNLDNI